MPLEDTPRTVLYTCMVGNNVTDVQLCDARGNARLFRVPKCVIRYLGENVQLLLRDIVECHVTRLLL